MNLFEYVPLMKEMSTPVAYVGVGLLALFLVFVFFKMLGGMIRGGWRQLVRTLATLVAAIASYIFAVTVSNGIIGALDVNSLEGLITRIEGFMPEAGEAIRQGLASINTEIIEYIILLPASLFVLPLVATVLFILAGLVLKIIVAIIIKIFRFKRAKSNNQRLCGALLGGINALICVVMVMLPLCGAITIVDEAYCQAIESAEDDKKAELTETYEEYFLPFTENPAFTFIESIGAGAMSDGIATVKIGGEKTNMRKEVLSVAHIIIVDASNLKGADFYNLTDENKTAIGSIIDALYESPLMSRLLVGGIQSASSLIESGIIPIDMGEDHGKLFDELMLFFETVSRDSLGSDLSTIKDLYFTVSDSGVLSAMKNGDGDILSLLQEQRKNGDDTVNKLVDILQANARTSPLVTALTETLISSLSSNIDLGDGVTVTYDSLKSGMSDVLAVDRGSYETEDEYKEALTGTLDTTLRDHGIELEAEIVDNIAEYVDTEYSHLEELTDEEFNDILLYYYDAYLEYIDTGDIPEELGGVSE